MTEPVDSSFINVDLELHCAEDLAPLRAHFGEAARRKATEFDIRSVVRQTLNLYEPGD